MKVVFILCILTLAEHLRCDCVHNVLKLLAIRVLCYPVGLAVVCALATTRE
jgi:hypothetical protein